MRRFSDRLSHGARFVVGAGAACLVAAPLLIHAAPVKGAQAEKGRSATTSPVNWVESAREGRYPAAVAAMLAKGNGVAVQDVFAASGGLTGYVMSAATGERRIYYVTADGTAALYGLLLNERLENLTAGHLAAHTNPLNPRASVGTMTSAAPLAASAPSAPSAPVAASGPAMTAHDLWGAGAPAATAAPNLSGPLEMARKAPGAAVEGSGLDVYIVFDPACPFCHKTWMDSRSLLDRLRLHWIPVGALGPRSQLLAQTYLDSPDKARAMTALARKELVAAGAVSTGAAQILASNNLILDAANAKSVPLLLYSDQGRARQLVGAPGQAQWNELLRAAQRNP